MSDCKRCTICEEPVRASVTQNSPRAAATLPHYHHDERGNLVKCYHEAKSLFTNWRFWAGMTLGFPAEHLLWEKVWPFSLVTHWMGL